MLLLILFSFFAGIVTVLSPCILPILPVLLGASVGTGHARALGIILGLIASFTFFTLALTALVQTTGISPDILRYCAIGLIIIFGLIMLFPKLGNLFAQTTSNIASLGSSVQTFSEFAGSGFVSGLIMGGALGLLWTPCAGPILATITTLVATHAITIGTVIITLAYSAGAALPMFLIAYGSNKIIASTVSLTQYSDSIRKVFGLLMIMGALAIAFHVDVRLQQFTLDYFPTITIETNPLIQKELDRLNPKKNNSLLSADGGLHYKAPALVGITDWLNSPALALEQLRGKVVLIDFWTYSCINCVRTLPYIKEWYDKYHDKGLVIIGVHTPEFEFEKNVKNVQEAVNRFGIRYPVALDNSYATWQNYSNHYWPAHYLIDQTGFVISTHFGEGAYTETENEIRKLLGLEPLSEIKKEEPQPVMAVTPETYVGYQRGYSYISENVLQPNVAANYTYSRPLKPHQIGLTGTWLISSQSVQAQSDGARLDINFIANRVYLVMSAQRPTLITILLDNAPVPTKYYTKDYNPDGTITVDASRMYDLLDLKGAGDNHTLSLICSTGVSAYAFTFGAGNE